MRSEQAVLEAPADALEAPAHALGALTHELEREDYTTLPEPVRSRIVRALICAFAAACGRVVGQGRCRCHPSHELEYAGGD